MVGEIGRKEGEKEEEKGRRGREGLEKKEAIKNPEK